MIVVTGAAGFIGSCLVSHLNKLGYQDIILVDDFSKSIKHQNLKNKKFRSKIQRQDFFEWIKGSGQDVEFIFHIGARTDTTEFDVSILKELNYDFSKQVWDNCVKFSIPLVYASSAATYGLGEYGYNDDHSIIPSLEPLNPYGNSKNDFDKWVIKQIDTPPFWSGLKFFNVYGPNEFHKDRMASVIFHAYSQIKRTGKMKLFRSHNSKYKDGCQLRDFIYVKDIINVCSYLLHSPPSSGIYNLGSGKARTFIDLAKNTFKAMHKEENITFIDTPIDIRDKYQYYTQANMLKLIESGYNRDFISLEEGIADYVTNYLDHNLYY